MDPLSDVLSLLKLQSYVSGGFDAGGEWAIAVDRDPSTKFYAAVTGTCWLAVDGVPDPVRIESGDCVLLASGRPFRVASNLSLPAVDVATIGTGFMDGSVTRLNGGGDFFCVGAIFTLTGEHAGVVRDMLPPIVHIANEGDKAVLRWCIERMRAELRDRQPGGYLIAQQLATMMLIHALRLYLVDEPRARIGWFFALADKQMAAAIGAMHDEPARRWTLASLARRAGMSRTSFTLRFKAMVGTSPIEYLTQWRMMLAGDRLVSSSESIADIASALGYASESAFSTAFKRVRGCSPSRFVRSDPRLRLESRASLAKHERITRLGHS